MEKLICFLVLAAASAALANGQPMRLETGKWNTDIRNENYPELSPRAYRKTWELVSEPDSTIRVLCDDFRLGMTDDPCRVGYVIFDDGVSQPMKKCGSVSNLVWMSKSSNIKISLNTTDYSGYLSCKAKSSVWPKPESSYSLSPDQDPVALRRPKEASPYYDKVWEFKTIPGTKLSFVCDHSFSREVCLDNLFHVDDGTGPKIYCNENLSVISSGTTMKVRIEMDKFGDVGFYCAVQSITGPNANEADNTPSDEDSREYGEGPGKKSTTCNCGWTNKNKKRIFNGTDAIEGEFPWMVGIRNKNDYTICGGSIITAYHILTAAHCVVNSKVRNMRDIDPTDIIPIVGAHKRYEDASHGMTQRLRVLNIFIPKEYLKFERNYDVAVIWLRTKIEFSKFVGPVCLSPERFPIVNKIIKIMGWGLKENYEGSEVLLKSKVKVISHVTCGQPEWHICTRVKQSTVCNGDSGSPLVWRDPETNRYTQVAIVSFGAKNCLDQSSKSSNVSFHYNYIRKIIKTTTPEIELCRKEGLP